MHRLALQIDLPVFGPLPVERLAEAPPTVRRGPVPTWRSDPRLGAGEPGRLHDLGALPVAYVDDHRLEIERLVVDVSDKTHGHVGPQDVAVLAKKPLLEPEVCLVAGDHLALGFFGRFDIVWKRDVVHRHRLELVGRVTKKLAVGGVHRHDLSVQAGERHARLGLLEQGAKANLALSLGLLGSVPFGDVAYQRQQALRAFRIDVMDCDLHLQPPAILGDQAGLVSDWRRAAGDAFREGLPKLLPFFEWRNVDEGRQRAQLLLRVAGELHVSIVARDAPGVGSETQVARARPGRATRWRSR